MSSKKAGPVFIPPSSYPTLSQPLADALSRAIRNPTGLAAAERTLAGQAPALRQVVLTYIERIHAAAAAGDYGQIYKEAHEIRGLASSAGLAATGRIAAGLCRYLDTFAQAGRIPDPAVVQLHLTATTRAAHAEDEATRLGDTVARELAELVDKRLAEITGPSDAPGFSAR